MPRSAWQPSGRDLQEKSFGRVRPLQNKGSFDRVDDLLEPVVIEESDIEKGNCRMKGEGSPKISKRHHRLIHKGSRQPTTVL